MLRAVASHRGVRMPGFVPFMLWAAAAMVPASTTLMNTFREVGSNRVMGVMRFEHELVVDSNFVRQQRMNTMDRRQWMTRGAVVGATAATLVTPGQAQTATPDIRWRIASSYPKSLVSIYGAVENMAKRVGELTGGKFHLSMHAAGELVPALGVFDAVSNGTVEAGHSASYFYIGKDPAFGFHTALPFGLNMRGQNAWLYEGGVRP